MKIDPTISAQLALLQPNQIGMLAWSLLADPLAHQVHLAGGVPGQPDPDTPQPPEPSEPGSPTLPDDAPPAPVA
jgi:hypothetical protein